MNLAYDPWIPCILVNGQACFASLNDCFTNKSIAELSVRPYEKVAVMRLLLCVAYGAVGIPDNYEKWTECRNNLTDAAEKYLKKWQSSFELFDDTKPFLQIVGLRSASKTEKTAHTSKLDFALAAGDASTLFDHGGLDKDRSTEIKKLALDLLTFQMFSLCGLIGSVVWNKHITSRSSTDAPCVGPSMLHTFIIGKYLADTIWLNMLSCEELQNYTKVDAQNWQGRPIWEKMPKGLEDIDAVNNATRTFLGRMVPISRAILLNSDCASLVLGSGLTYPSFSNEKMPFPAEPTATVISTTVKKTTISKVLGAQENKSLWRVLHALTVQRHGDEPGGCLALSHIYEDNVVGISVVALLRGTGTRMSVADDAVESFFSIPKNLCDDDGNTLYANEVHKAEDIEQKALAFAVERWRKLVDGGWDIRLKLAGPSKYSECVKLRGQAARDYWTDVENGLPLLFDELKALNTDKFVEAQGKWRNLLRRSALNAFETACSRDNERELRAYVLAKRVLLAMTKKILELSKAEG